MTSPASFTLHVIHTGAGPQVGSCWPTRNTVTVPVHPPDRLDKPGVAVGGGLRVGVGVAEGVGVGVSVGVGVGVGVYDGVGLGVSVGVGEGVCVKVGVGEGAGVDVGGIGVGVDVGTGVAVGAPHAARNPATRTRLISADNDHLKPMLRIIVLPNLPSTSVRPLHQMCYIIGRLYYTPTAAKVQQP